MATLGAAIAVTQSERVGSTLPRCRHDLHFDVPSVLTEYLGEQCRTAESRLGFGRTHTVRVVECFRVTHRAHAAATAAAERLDHDAAGVALEEFTHLVEVGVRRCRRQDRYAGVDRRSAGAGLVAESPENLGVRADEDDARLGTRLREFGVLTEEPVTRVHVRGACFGRDLQQSPLIEIRGCARRSERHRLRGRRDVRTGRVVLGVHRHRLDPEFTGSSNDPQRNFAAVRNQQSHLSP